MLCMHYRAELGPRAIVVEAAAVVVVVVVVNCWILADVYGQFGRYNGRRFLFQVQCRGLE